MALAETTKYNKNTVHTHLGNEGKCTASLIARA